MLLPTVLAVALAAQALAAETPEKSPPQPRSGKVFTNEDLRTAKGNVTAPGSEVGGPSDQEQAKGATGEQEKEPSEEERREKLRADLQAQIDQQRELIAARRQDIARMEQELNDVSGQVYSITGIDGNPVGRRGSILGFLREAQSHIDKAQEMIASLEEQARRQGIRVQVP